MCIILRNALIVNKQSSLAETGGFRGLVRSNFEELAAGEELLCFLSEREQIDCTELPPFPVSFEGPALLEQYSMVS